MAREESNTRMEHIMMAHSSMGSALMGNLVSRMEDSIMDTLRTTVAKDGASIGGRMGRCM